MSNFLLIYEEWSLIIFTTFCQMSIAFAIIASLMAAIEERKSSKILWFLSLITVGIGGIASLLHLQNPFNALYTLTQIGSSWLSREIVSVGLFGALVFWQVIKGSKIIGYLTSIVGLLLVYVMSQVYASVEEMPYWRFLSTGFAFYGTTALFSGAVGYIASRNLESNAFKKFSIVAYVAGLIFVLAAKIAWVTTSLKNPNLAIPEHFTQGYFNLDIQLLALLFASVLLLIKKPIKFPIAMYLAFLILICGELAGRAVFFLAQFKIGV